MDHVGRPASSRPLPEQRLGLGPGEGGKSPAQVALGLGLFQLRLVQEPGADGLQRFRPVVP